MAELPIPLNFDSGLSRDGTLLDSNRYADSLWCRWRNKKPRKMPGYKRITNTIISQPRKVHAFYSGSNIYVHVGSSLGIQQFVLDYSGNLISSANRTPSGYANDAGWTIDAIFDTTSSAIQLIAHGVPDQAVTSSVNKAVPVSGILTASTPLALFTDPGVSSGTWVQPMVAGGCVCVQPYLFDFDISGLVQWSAPNLPFYLGTTGGSTGAGQVRISAQKIVAGLPLRGGGTQQPAVLFWSLSEVISGVFVGGTPVFAFSTISSSSSILSTDCVIEYDGLYFWAGIDRFLVFNGTVVEVPNTQNQDWFFDNLTPGSEAKVQAFKVPRYGEIWWLAPMFGATECSHAIIYNVRENVWYDTVLPDGGRGTGYTAQGLRYPIMAGTVPNGTGGFSLWLHETGLDKIDGATTSAVRSYFETGYLGGPKGNPPNDEGLSVGPLEPDFTQTGDMSVYLIGQSNVRAPVTNTATETLKFIPSTPQEQLVSFKNSFRLLRLHVESNVIGGNYIAGHNLLHAGSAKDARIVS